MIGALTFAKQLEGHTDIPLWAQQTPGAFVHLNSVVRWRRQVPLSNRYYKANSS